MSTSWRALGRPAIAALALVSSAVGIANKFTYDDRYIIELNPATHDLHGWWRVFFSAYWPKDWGGDGYRPLTILAFKIESVLGARSPIPFHAANILLYACVSLLVFALARRMLPLWAAWVAAALFAVHPVHVEAVANVVGQSELLVAAALLGATILYIRDRQTGPLRLRTMVGVGVLYAVGCFAKEHAVVLPAILVAAELTILAGSGKRETRSELRPFYLALAAIALGYIAIRTAVLSDHGIGGFQPFVPFATLHISGRDRVLTAIGVVPQWARLLYWPADLSSEYGPPEIEIAQGVSISQIPGLVLLVAILAFCVVLRRRKPVISFGIAFACIALLPTSNFIVPAGILLAERTLFLPSVGAMLVAGELAVLAVLAVRARATKPALVERAGLLALVVLLGLGIWRSTNRSKVWHDNDTLFRRAVIDAPYSYRAHYMLGAWHFENKRKRDGEAEYRKALHLFPYDPFVAYNMAEQYRSVGMCGPAVPLYRWAHSLDLHFPLGHTAFAMCLLEEGQYDEARTKALDAIRIGGDVRFLRRIIFVADSAKAAEHHGKPT